MTKETVNLDKAAPAPAAPPPEAKTPPPEESRWLEYDQQLVMVQLKLPLVAVQYPNRPVETDSGDMAVTKVLMGLCQIRKEDLEAPIPSLEVVTREENYQNLVVRTLVPLEQIAYISRVTPVDVQG